jgi:hypothetical protein
MSASLVDAAAARVGRANILARGALLASRAGVTDLRGDLEGVVELLGESLTLLSRAGAEDSPLAPDRDRSSLADLAALERVRPEAQDLADELRRLLPLAERIDKARGRALDRPVAGSAGLDLAEDIVQLLARIELDLHGPALAVTGGRE